MTPQALPPDGAPFRTSSEAVPESTHLPLDDGLSTFSVPS